MKFSVFTPILFAFIFLVSCDKSDDPAEYVELDPYPNITAAFGTAIDLENLDNYANQTVPVYITKDNTGANAITNAGATLGRVLFYDKSLSATNTVSCSSCHIQANAFGDVAVASIGINGTTDRHSMRLINTRFSNEGKFFWDERAQTLEQQTTQPIQNHIEMGFSGTLGDANLTALTTKLQYIGYYQELFTFVYGDPQVTEVRIQNALAQFIRSIQSFDSKYDIGRSAAGSDLAVFPNYTEEESMGKRLFLGSAAFDENGIRINGGAGCISCHAAPEYSINPNIQNNGVIGVLGNPNAFDLTNNRAPSLRDVVQPNGQTNGPFMHDGSITTLHDVVNHYNVLNNPANNTAIDHQLGGTDQGQQLNLTPQQIDAIVAFMRTLSGTDVYTNPKWGNPF